MPEIQFIAASSEIQIEIVPFIIDGPLREDIPSSVMVNTTLNDLYLENHERKVLPLLRVLSKIFFGVLAHGNLRFSAIRDIAGFCHHGNLVAQWISKNVKAEDVLYTYWFERLTYGAALYKSASNAGNLLISRAHGYDLYEHLRPHKFIPFRKFTLQNLDKLFLISNVGLAYIRSKYQNSNALYLSRLGVSSQPTRATKGAQKITIVSCSSVIPIKRLDLIFDSLDKYAKLVEEAVEWVHFGEGKQFDWLVKKTTQARPNLEIKLKGHTHNSKILKYYQDNWVDLFINLSDSEGVPVSIMEAISFGIPVIARDVGGNREIVNEHTGSLVPSSFTAAEIASEINRLKQSAIDRTKILDFFNANYSAKENFQDFYQKVLKSK